MIDADAIATFGSTDVQAEPKPSAAGAHGDLARANPSGEFLNLIEHDFARRHLLLSAGECGGVELLWTSAGTRPWIIHNVGVRLGRPVRAEHVDAETLAAAIDQVYAANRARAAADSDGGDETGAVTMGDGLTGDSERDLKDALREAEQDLLSTSGKAPAVRLVDLIFFEALQRGASDVHVQPQRERTLVRYRLDGALHTVRELPAAMADAVVSRIKVMANMDVAERRAPQDGRATVRIGAGSHAARRVDLRISTLPSTYGERVVVRMLDPSRSPHTLSFVSLGMPPDVERLYLEHAGRASGIVLSTGPTGSGKTTTLYTTLRWLGESHSQGAELGASGGGCELNMVTIEDPVEYDLSTGVGAAVSQTQVDPRKNVTFAAGLRHILRQDPDVIMVGEVRDEETARIAVQASLTGHLVLSTLHTSDAASAVARLLDLGIEPYLVSSSLSAVLAQRLVRVKHVACGGAGCEACVQTGFKGRTGVFELLVLDPRIRDLINRRASAQEIKSAAVRGGMVTLKEAGAKLVREGRTTAAEMARVIDATEELET